MIKSDRYKLKSFPKWFYLILIIIPILFLAIIELSLHAFDYGKDYSTFIKLDDQFNEHFFFNPNLPEKYFVNSSVIPSVIPDAFRIKKNKKTFRVFALGGSTTAGFPYPPNVSFPRILKNKLMVNFQDLEFEVINLGISAINSVTIKDIIGDVLDQKPDLIIIYAGHNEYYGALGPASGVKGSNFLAMTDMYLSLKSFRFFQLIENTIHYLLDLLNSETSHSKTLMAQMSGNNLIDLESDLYSEGIDQFENNLEYILSECRNSEVNVIIGTLVSNLMQEPLCKFSGCENLLTDFNNALVSDTLRRKDNLYRIKELDNLRFRAPEAMNKIIKSAAKKYNYSSIEIQDLFERNSEHGIIGYNLMTDHLHPNIKGNYLIADQILKKINENNFLDKSAFSSENFNSDSDFNNFKTYSKIDSSFAELRIAYLKQDFPFQASKSNKSILHFVKNIQDSIAWEILFSDLSWENGHIKMAEYYFDNQQYDEYFNEMYVLMMDKPFYEYPFSLTIKKLESVKQNELLKKSLLLHFSYFNNLKSAEKLGDIYHAEKNIINTLKYYEYSVNNGSGNAKIYFNLSGIYFSQKNLKKAITNIQNCLKLDPQYPNAKKIYDGLLSILNSRK